MARDVLNNSARSNSPSKMRAHKPSSSHDSDRNLLEMLSSTVACLKQKKMDLEALGCLEQSLWLKRRMFGVDNSVVHKSLNEVVLSYNAVAMQYLDQGQFDQCLAMLRKAEAITCPGNFKRCQALQILTFNNIGCCYRKLGKLKSALKYLKEAAQIGAGAAHVKNLSITHLNLCAIQSQLGRHDLALEHAQAAIFHTQEELVSLEDGFTHERDENGAFTDALNPKNREEKIISLAVAYHNLAVELEFNGRGEASLQWYKKALQLVWKYRDTNEALCESFKKIFLDAKKKQQTANLRQNGIPATSSKVNNSSTRRRPITRPQSAYPRRGNEVDRDVSYSATVASQCYKATKPSTANQRYESSHSTATQGKPQRPISATRQRPVSAKASLTRGNNCNNSRRCRESIDDAFEQHWSKLEKEHSLTEPQASQVERKTRRPQSASSATANSRRQNTRPIGTQRQQKQEGYLCFGADNIGNDEDYGVIHDDGESDDAFDKSPDTKSSEYSNNHEIDSGSTKLQSERLARKQRPRTSGNNRHHRVMEDRGFQALFNQSVASETESVASSSQDPQSVLDSSRTGYSGDDDTDPELPAQRVCHMEYLRRMRTLAESIKGDLNGANPVNSTHSKSSTLSDNECSSKVSTPRSATSKLRDRIEQARRDSSENLTSQLQSLVPVESSQHVEDDGVELQETVHVWESEAEVCDAESKLFQAAAGCRVQAFYRGYRCRAEVRILKKVQHENDSAIIIQQQVRQYIESVREDRVHEEIKMQLLFQKEEVEDMAACLIQRLCRRVLSRTNVSLVKSENEDEKVLPAYQQRPFSDVAAVSKSQLNQELSHIYSAAPESHINLNNPEPNAPCRSSAISSLPVEDLDGTQLQCEPTPRSDNYDDVEWKSESPDSTYSSLRSSRCTVEDQHNAVIRIQLFMKSVQVRRCIAIDNAKHLSRMYIERKHFSVALDHALTLEQEFLEELGAIKIQALVRGQQSRLLTECIKVGVYTAANTIQRSFRFHRQSTQRSVDEGVRIIAVRTIQQVYRDYEARKTANHQAAVDIERSSVQLIAASTIQSFWRQYFTERDHNIEEIEAATCIQALGRGHLSRKSSKSLHNSSSSGLSKHSSAFSIPSSSAEKLVEYEDSDIVHNTKSLSINYSFLPTCIRELYVSSSGNSSQRMNNEIDAQEIAELGLTFEDFLRELETCTDQVVASSALDAMRILVETSPETTQTLANVVKVARGLDRRLQEGFWNEAVKASSIALLHAFRDVLDA